MINTRNIQIRDPFVYCDRVAEKYYMYGTTDKNCWSGPGDGFDAYVSSDLANWDGPIVVFRPDDEFWGKENFWAPEVFEYSGRYFMFATFKNQDCPRGTAILVSDSPEGPFVEHSKGAVTPDDWECLDGTLFIDDARKPWIVFCHEWQQVHDGKMCAARLSDDLSRMIDDPVVLFSASESGWAHEYEWQGKSGYITDGPCLISHDGKLMMLWSSFINDKYAIGLTVSETGNIPGPWKHLPAPVYIGGGHAMVFEDFCGKKKLTFHQPNETPYERAVFLDFDEILSNIL